VSKRAITTLRAPDGRRMKAAKGAPQVILRMAADRAAVEPLVKAAVNSLASRGFRALGVAVCREATDDPAAEVWEVVGILSLFDPPRPDTRKTIAAAIANGVEVKMVTGDQTAIAKETCRELGMGTNILQTEALDDPSLPQEAVDAVIMEAHGFAEVKCRCTSSPSSSESARRDT